MAILDRLRSSKLLNFSKKASSSKAPSSAERLKAKIYSRDQHNLSRKNIAESALKVLYRLHKAGFEAYLVGGAVRDLLLGFAPKDFDVATNARPEEICELFRNSRMIGRRFKLVHVRFGREIIEVATFRAAPEGQSDDSAISDQGRILRDNVYGELVDDAWRRDFTINALYYNIADFSIVDYVDGVSDVRARRLRLIGDAAVRYPEDPMRLLRAIRFAAKLGVNIDAETERAFEQYGELLKNIPPARMFDEVVKLFHCGAGATAVELLIKYQLMEILFPSFAEIKKSAHLEQHIEMMSRATANTDKRLAAEKSVTPAFVLAAILWHAQRYYFDELNGADMSVYEKEQRAHDKAIETQLSRVAIPRRFTSYVREIWSLQKKFEKRTPKRVERLISHRRFRTAYDFLILRHESGEDVGELADWWTRYEHGTTEQRAALMQELTPNKPKRRRRKNPKPRRGNRADVNNSA
ncbi:MAG: polynucleotide adenylyltransferase PcnB [Gammaproteobacteria bacterium]